jgi:hypothetical protein
MLTPCLPVNRGYRGVWQDDRESTWVCRPALAVGHAVLDQWHRCPACEAELLAVEFSSAAVCCVVLWACKELPRVKKAAVCSIRYGVRAKQGAAVTLREISLPVSAHVSVGMKSCSSCWVSAPSYTAHAPCEMAYK